MQKALHIRTTVQPDGKVEFANPELAAIINYGIKYSIGRREE